MESLKNVQTLEISAQKLPNFRYGKFWPDDSRDRQPRGPRIENIQSQETILKKSSFQYGMKCSIETGFFIPSPSLAAEKQGPG